MILSVPPEKAAKRMLFLASARFIPLDNDRAGDSGVAVGTNGRVGRECYAMGEDSDTVNLAKSYDGLRRERFEELVWDHTQDALACISSGKTISGMIGGENIHVWNQEGLSKSTIGFVQRPTESKENDCTLTGLEEVECYVIRKLKRTPTLVHTKQ